MPIFYIGQRGRLTLVNGGWHFADKESKANKEESALACQTPAALGIITAHLSAITTATKYSCIFSLI